MKSPPKNEPERGLKSRHVQLIAIGGTIGTGLFLGSGQTIQLAGPSIILGYLLVGIACFLLMRALGELLLSNLGYRSFVDFVSEYLGDRVGFVIGWTYWICWITIAMAELTAVGIYFRFWFPSLPQWVPGLVFLVILLLLNLTTVGAFGEVEFWFALIKVLAIIVLIIVGAWLVIINFKTPFGHAGFSNLTQYGGFFPKGGSGFLLSLQMTVFSFIGIEMVGMTAAETQDPENVIPKAVNNIPLRIIIFYVGAMIAIMVIYPWTAVNADQSPFVMVFKAIGIPAAAGIVNFVVITAAASACNSSLFITGRMLASLTKDARHPATRKLSLLSKHHVPGNAIGFSSIVIAITIGLNYFIPDYVFTLVSSVATTCFLLIWASVVLTHLKYRKTESGRKSTFKMPGAPVTDYLILVLLAVVTIVLCFRWDTGIALLLSLAWFIVMYIVSTRIYTRHKVELK